jgi:hypothetical protein
MGTSEDSYRLYNCARCAQQVRICRRCDRGNRYCAAGCGRERRRESLRRACSRYQQSYRGACKHAARQRAWRSRHAQKVTHQGSLGIDVAAIVQPQSLITSEETRADTGFEARACAREFVGRPTAEPRCSLCGSVLAAFARLGWLRSSA